MYCIVVHLYYYNYKIIHYIIIFIMLLKIFVYNFIIYKIISHYIIIYCYYARIWRDVASLAGSARRRTRTSWRASTATWARHWTSSTRSSTARPRRCSWRCRTPASPPVSCPFPSLSPPLKGAVVALPPARPWRWVGGRRLPPHRSFKKTFGGDLPALLVFVLGGHSRQVSFSSGMPKIWGKGQKIKKKHSICLAASPSVPFVLKAAARNVAEVV